MYSLRWPFRSRLIPVERSGHISQKSTATFAAPDDADKAEGVAGRAWRTFRVLIVANLPDLNAAYTEAGIREYAKKTWIDAKWVRARIAQRKTLARSYVGIPIRVDGKPWGVIIIDSLHPNSIETLGTPFYDLMGKTLTKLLERV